MEQKEEETLTSLCFSQRKMITSKWLKASWMCIFKATRKRQTVTYAHVQECEESEEEGNAKVLVVQVQRFDHKNQQNK